MRTDGKEHLFEVPLLVDITLFFGVAIVGITELLSFFHALNALWVVFLWSIVGIVGWLLFGKKLWEQRRSFLSYTRNILRGETITVILIGTILLVTFAIAISTPPNNHDSISYHMTRVAYWVQHQSVVHYPALDLRQLYMPPLTEYLIAQLYLLTDSDLLAHMPQWLAFAGSLFLVTLIARELGAERRTVRFALVFAATLPIGILQSTNATATHAVTFWLLMLAYLILRDRCSQSPANALRIGVVLGLSLLTKLNAYFFAPAFVLWYILSLRKQPTRLLSHALIVGSIALSLNATQYLRNIESIGHFLVPRKDMATNINTEFSPAIAASNILKNASLETGLLMVGNPFVERGIQNIHAVMHVEIDRTNTESQEFNIPKSQTHEVFAGNPFHFLIIILSVVSVPLLSLPKKKQHYWYLGAILGGLVITWSFLSWNPYGTRLHMPFLILAAPVVGIAFATATSRKWLRLIAVFLYVAAIPALLFSDLNPIVPNTLLMGKGAPSILIADRWPQYFYDLGPQKQTAYEHAIDELMRMDCHNVGVLSYYHYPLFVRAKQMGTDIRFVSMTEKQLPLAKQEHLCALLFMDEGKKYLPAGQGDPDGKIVLLPVQESVSGRGDSPGTVL
ncbi:MAG TPA: glycosyltransferase family 39 protein [Candidatus Peribacteraceae bacterium]|nr:glycosyltransferase family 39 protein [Candidatus Peribacteraceae bacterium]